MITRGFTTDRIITRGFGLSEFIGELITVDFNIARIKTADLEL